MGGIGTAPRHSREARRALAAPFDVVRVCRNWFKDFAATRWSPVWDAKGRTLSAAGWVPRDSDATNADAVLPGVPVFVVAVVVA